MGARDREGLRGWRRATLVAIKTVHTAAFFSIGSCLAYFAYSSLAKRSDRRAAIAGAVVTGETTVYALNGFRCPLTSLAERLGSEHGSVADIYLPPWIEDHLPYVTGPIFAGAVVLHARNILRSRRGHSAALPIPLDDPVERNAFEDPGFGREQTDRPLRSCMRGTSSGRAADVRASTSERRGWRTSSVEFQGSRHST